MPASKSTAASTDLCTRRHGPHLQGNRKTPVRPLHEPIDPPTLSDVHIRNAILLALQPGPLAKWQLRDQLHVSEARLAPMLKTLRRERLIKLVGSGSNNWRWALIDAVIPDPRRQDRPFNTSLRSAPAPEKPKPTSWWTDHAAPQHPRDRFVTAAAARDEELRGSRDWRTGTRVMNPQD